MPKTIDEPQLPAELTLEEAARAMGIHRSNVHRQFRASLRWATHRKRRVRVVPTELVIRAIANERNSGPVLPVIQRLSERISAILLVQERQALGLARVAKKLGVEL